MERLKKDEVIVEVLKSLQVWLAMKPSTERDQLKGLIELVAANDIVLISMVAPCFTGSQIAGGQEATPQQCFAVQGLEGYRTVCEGRLMEANASTLPVAEPMSSSA